MTVVVQQLAALLKGGRAPARLWDELWLLYAGDAAPGGRLDRLPGPDACPRLRGHAGCGPRGSPARVARSRRHPRYGGGHALRRQRRRRNGHERRVWGQLAACFDIAEASGCPLADVLTRFAAQLEAEDDAEAARQTALAGPRATVRLLGWLPLLGLGLGMLLGVDPVRILLGTPYGTAALATGAGAGRGRPDLVRQARPGGGGAAVSGAARLDSERGAGRRGGGGLPGRGGRSGARRPRPGGPAAPAPGLRARQDAGKGAEGDGGRAIQGLRDTAMMLELIGAMLDAGAGLGRSLELVAALASPELNRPLRPVVSALAIGADWDTAWRSSEVRSPELLALRDALGFAALTGAPSSAILYAQAARMRRARFRTAEKRAAALGVKLVLPLGLCSLPAFVCLGVVPVLLAMLPA